jgi:hypothetical protein
MAQESTYTPEDGETICAGLAEGNSLLSICNAMGVAYTTAMDWEKSVPEHGVNSARAREIGYRAISEQCLRIADTPLVGEERTTKADGSIEVKEGDMLGHRRLQIDTRLRLLGKWAPKVYGDKTTIAGDPDAPLTASLSDEQLMARIAALKAKVDGNAG